MLRLEEKIRFSKDYFNRCSRVEGEVDGWIRVSKEVQEFVAYVFGYRDTLYNMLAVDYIRRAQYIYPDDKRFQVTSVYVRENIAKPLYYNTEQVIENVDIFNINLQQTSLFDILDKSKYNLVIGSSASLQPFRAIVNILKDDIVSKYKSGLQISIIYINEAHAVDVWPIGYNGGLQNRKHRSLNDRLKCAQKFIEKYNYQEIPMYIDTMDNIFEKTFKVWPFRAIIIKNNKICYCSQPSNAEYDITDLYNFLDNVIV